MTLIMMWQLLVSLFLCAVTRINNHPTSHLFQCWGAIKQRTVPSFTLPFAVQAGFIGIHGLEPPAGNNLATIKQQYGHQLVLIGSFNVNLLCGSDLGAVSREIDRCLRDGGDKMFMLSSPNSIFKGMKPSTVKTYFKFITEHS
jgi:hypothetical protein